MARPDRLFLIASCLLLAACPDKETDPLVTPPETLKTSARGNLRFKGPERFHRDLATALELPDDQVCKELGLYPCTSLVHNVALGGIDPYGTGLYEAPGVTALTTPLVVERVVWSACARRVEADLAAPAQAVVFRGLEITEGRLKDPEGQAVRAVIAEVVQRGLLREPYEVETARYIELARQIEAVEKAAPARAWMLALCFAVLSSPEAVFY